MRQLLRCRLVVPLVLLFQALTVAAEPGEQPVAATIETTLATGSGQIRQWAFDGDANTFFASARNAGGGDHLTLVFDRPVAVKSILATTGRPGGEDRLNAGAIEVSEDGKKFEPVGEFAEGVGRAKTSGRAIRAVRIRPAGDLKHPLVIREIAIESTPAVARFRYPVEFIVDVSDAPELKEWAEKTARICERAYPMINEELKSAGFRPPHLVRMALKTSYKGVAAAGGGRITGSVRYFKSHPNDVGAMVHETAHIVQSYRGRGLPGWLVEGIADYIRFYKYEPKKPGPFNPDRVRYNDSYRVSAAFLAFLTEKYDRDIVRKLNQLLREGKYKDEVFVELTKKTLAELNEEWRTWLRR